MTGWRRMLQPAGAVHGKLVHSRRVQMLASHFADLIPPQHSVLDVGCGDGLIDTLIAARRPDLEIAGVDVLVRPDARIAVVTYDGCHLPFKDGSWDTVLFCDVLHHTTDPVTLLREAARVARHNVIIKDHTVQGPLARLTLRFMDVVGNAPHGVQLTYNYLTPAQWEEAFRQSGLRVEKLRGRLSLYPSWADRIFGRSLHFLALYRVKAPPP
jgi:2-polyprenyl-3-methyl-5-hydroxy-6-metoxy-1,4-benzoquinol methylase